MQRRVFHLLQNNSLQSLLAYGTLSLGSYIHIAFLARAYPEEDFAKWVFFLAANTVLDGLRSGLVLPWLVKYTQGNCQEENGQARDAILSLVLRLTLTLALLVSLMYWVWGQFHQELVGYHFLKWFPLTFIAQLPNLIATWQLILQRDFAKMFTVRAVFLGSFALFCLTNHQNPLSLEWVFVAFITTQGLSSVTAWLLGYMPRIPWWVKHSYGEEIWKFSPSTITSSLLVTGQHFLEISLIALFFDQAIVALYALPLRLLNGYDLILRALLANYFPQAGKLANSAADKPFTALMSRYAFGTSGLFLLISTLLIAFAGQVLHILGGEKYLASIPILSVMVLGTVFQPMSKVFGSALEVTGKPQWNTFLLTGAMFCSMALVFTAAITFQEITYVAVPVALVRLLHGITAGILANRATKQYFAKT